MAEFASLGIRQSPLGLIEILPTLGPIRQAGTFELLIEEAAEKDSQPFLDCLFIIITFECDVCQIINL